MAASSDGGTHGVVHMDGNAERLPGGVGVELSDD